MTPHQAAPLRGRRVAVTRDEGTEGPLGSLLRARGAEVVYWRATRTAPPADPAALEAALRDMERFDWIVFTSPRAVEAVTERLATPPGKPRVAAVGPGTARSLEERGWNVHLMPRAHRAAELVPALAGRGNLRGVTILFPASEIARPTLQEGLEARGATVVRVTAYRTVPAPVDGAAIEREMAEGGVDAVTFTSPSSVRALAGALGEERFRRLMAGTRIVSIGPTTSAALRKAGVAGAVEAEGSTLRSLAEKLVQILEE